MKNLIGYSFFTTQGEFEAWQLDNDDFKVHTVQPNANNFNLASKEKYTPDIDGDIEWGIFVTYSYPHID